MFSEVILKLEEFYFHSIKQVQKEVAICRQSPVFSYFEIINRVQQHAY
jgi:hypothetical protein